MFLLGQMRITPDLHPFFLQLGARTKLDWPARPNGSDKVLYPYGSGLGLGNRTLDILAEARGRGAAVGAFTVYSLEGIRAVVRAAEVTGCSAILQVKSRGVQQCIHGLV